MANQFFQIPITNQPNQIFTCTIPQGQNNITLNFIVIWNEVALYWMLSLTNAQIDLLEMLPLVNTDSNFLSQFAYFDIGSAYLMPTSNNAPAWPGLTDWGTNYVMAWGP